MVRALDELEAEGLLSADREDTSVSGKGRPRYGLAVDHERLLGGLREDDRVEPLVADIAE